MLPSLLQHLASRFHLSRSPRLFIWLVQLAIFTLSGIFAFLIRFEFVLKPSYLAEMALAVPVWVVVKAIVFRLLLLDRGWWRYASIPDLVRVGFGNVAASSVSTFVLLLVAPAGFPRSIYLLDFLLCANATAGIRLFSRMLREFAAQHESAAGKRVLIYGAGNAGAMLLREIRSNPRLAYDVRGLHR